VLSVVSHSPTSARQWLCLAEYIVRQSMASPSCARDRPNILARRVGEGALRRVVVVCSRDDSSQKRRAKLEMAAACVTACILHASAERHGPAPNAPSEELTEKVWFGAHLLMCYIQLGLKNAKLALRALIECEASLKANAQGRICSDTQRLLMSVYAAECYCEVEHEDAKRLIAGYAIEFAETAITTGSVDESRAAIGLLVNLGVACVRGGELQVAAQFYHRARSAIASARALNPDFCEPDQVALLGAYIMARLGQYNEAKQILMRGTA